MKSNFLKLVLPAFAILLAVGLAFATEESNLMQPGYADTPFGPQYVETDCDATSGNQCKVGSYDVYADIGLSDPLYERIE